MLMMRSTHQTFLLELLEEELVDKKNQHVEPQNGCLEKSCCCCCPKVLERRFLVVVARFLLREIGKWVNQKFCCHSTGGVAAEDPETGGSRSLSGQKGARKFIFVKFNAWEYGDSEVLWAALASKIFTAVGGFAITVGAVRVRGRQSSSLLEDVRR